ncbi:chorismate synthase [Cyclonatronum proteinivorum]|uniref:Chorismate synthase n=1 Tax=Cyclonatronum proteinivorum TaxID=1457365 RepID=A0A345UFR8_9BACT|nr:chorismate synthase [Cyclonatronum proteinivorum]AXI99319.1 chorismate synthase [Cyclonatronum proteinivorum]
MIRYLTAGESHGPELTGIVEGLPAGLDISAEAVSLHLARRQQGYGRGGRMAWEKDLVRFSSGLRFGKTMGSPVTMSLANRAWEKDAANWPVTMSLSAIEDEASVEKITLPRPGHADLVGVQKYAFDDIRPVIERSSARETSMRVACCGTARLFLKALGVEIGGHVLQIGAHGYESWEEIREIADEAAQSGGEALFQKADESEVRCLHPELTARMVDEIKHYRKAGSSLGGIYEIVVTGLPPGLGSYVQWDRKLDGQLAQAIMSTQAMKGVQIGMGFEAGKRDGRRVHDAITKDQNIPGGFGRKTNRAGGIEGGMTTGQPVLIQGVMKPIPTMLDPLGTVDIATKEPAPTRYERSDVCALPRAVVVAESVIAPVLANAILEKTGGDSMSEILPRFQNLF